MMTRTLATLTFTALVALTGTAAAQPVGAPPPHDPDVSQIGGQLVPVGQHHEYRYSYPRLNLALNPFGPILGIYSGSVSYGLSDNIALRVEGTVYEPIDSDSHGFELDLGLPLYLRRTYSGAFVEPGVMMRQFNEEPAEMGPQVLLGWHWMWDSGFNLALAGGVGRNLDDDDLFANGYLKVGFALH